VSAVVVSATVIDVVGDVEAVVVASPLVVGSIGAAPSSAHAHKQNASVRHGRYEGMVVHGSRGCGSASIISTRRSTRA
jgi:hypothetical protein